MKEYKYRGHTFRATSTTHANTGRPLYEIDGLKERGKRPFLTTIEQCKEYIRNYSSVSFWCVEYRMWGADGPSWAWFRDEENARKFYLETDYCDPPKKCIVNSGDWIQIKHIESLLED